MMINDDKENPGQIETELIEKNCDINDYINDMYDKYINLFKIILLSLCIIILIISFKKNKFYQQTKNDVKIGDKGDKEDKVEKNLDDKSNNELNDKTDNKIDDKTDNKIDDITDNKIDDKTDNKIDDKTDNKIDDKTDNKIDDTEDNKLEQGFVNLYIIAHKDFKNDVINNSNYKILCDNITQLKNKYFIEIIPTNSSENILYPKRLGYGEGSKIYYIWNLYKSGNISTKYVGFLHYRRLFRFKNNIPDLDTIFRKYDAVLKKREYFRTSIREHFKTYHIVHFLDESAEIIKEKFPEYYPHVETLFKRRWANMCNIFIMKKDDFIKWGEFVFGVLLELDRRYNLTTDEDTRNLIQKEINESKRYNLKVNYQSRLQGFILERMSDIFYNRFFKNRYELDVINL